MKKPNEEMLSDLSRSEQWEALEEEINVCISNAFDKMILKQSPVDEMKHLAGEINAYKTLKNLVNGYKLWKPQSSTSSQQKT